MIDIPNAIGAIIKIFDLVFLVFFIIYSLLTLRQVSIMNHSLVTRGGFILQALAILQLGLGIVVLVVVWVSL